MAQTSRTFRTAVVLASASAALGLLTACGSGDDGADAPEAVAGTAAPMETDEGGETPGSSASPDGDAAGETPASDSAKPADPSRSGSDSTKSAGGTTTERCHTSELRASVGPNHPGAGQENFSVVFTNTSGHTCTLRGYPGAAFTDADGKQVGSDPERTSGSPGTITLKPGASAWAGLSFSNPEISGAKTATPASLLVTPPNERDPLTVDWKGGEVPVSGNASKAKVSVLAPGSGE
ncbi:DUF4232 domain-containing protein [Strepomyces sp. STD 3.1]|uniref:DUF4232 domain-containing protein n=1 Tax=Streptomyces sp. NPDC058985 TaxID=3346684 RepID=UPI001F2466D2|nr:DUF4232 domain-containing protein [Streptomyces sp. STD 3.1]